MSPCEGGAKRACEGTCGWCGAEWSWCGVKRSKVGVQFSFSLLVVLLRRQRVFCLCVYAKKSCVDLLEMRGVMVLCMGSFPLVLARKFSKIFYPGRSVVHERSSTLNDSILNDSI